MQKVAPQRLRPKSDPSKPEVSVQPAAQRPGWRERAGLVRSGHSPRPPRQRQALRPKRQARQRPRTETMTESSSASCQQETDRLGSRRRSDETRLTDTTGGPGGNTGRVAAAEADSSLWRFHRLLARRQIHIFHPQGIQHVTQHRLLIGGQIAPSLAIKKRKNVDNFFGL